MEKFKQGREVVIVADDFTGANDAGVSLAMKGKKVSVAFHSSFSESTDVLVINTDSRAFTTGEAKEAITGISARIKDSNWLIKKIDSTLRGNISIEVETLLALSGKRQAIIAPAYPAAGRITRNGQCLVHGIPVNETEFASDPKTPVCLADIGEILAEHSTRSRKIVTPDQLAQSLKQGIELIIVDAASDDDLDMIVSAAFNCESPPLLVGSAGLCDAFARSQASVKHPQLLAVIGSMSEIAQKQIQYVADMPGVTRILIATDDILTGELEGYIRQITAAIHEGNHCIVYTCPDHDSRHQISVVCEQHQLSAIQLGEKICLRLGEITRSVLEQSSPDALYVSGGDVSMAVAHALGATGFEITGCIAQCVPTGRFTGCSWQKPVMTKAGGFGKEETLRDVLYFIEEKVSD